MASKNSVLEFINPFAFRDSGPPTNSFNYTTIILIHGLGFHSAIFSKLLPIAADRNLRLLLINRRDMPGSVPYSASERSQLREILYLEQTKGCEALEMFMTERARELYSFIGEFVHRESIPKRKGLDGGINLVSWSLGATWLLSFLASADSFPSDEVDLTSYMHCISFYDPPFHTFGWPSPTDAYNPLFDSSIDPADVPKAFSNWVSGYFDHGEGLDGLDQVKPASSPPPTLTTMTPIEVEDYFHSVAADADGSDTLHMRLSIETGLNLKLRNKLFDQSKSFWNKLPINYIWCDRSVWEMPYGAEMLNQHIRVKKENGEMERSIEIIKVPGANHFLHFDDPAKFFDVLNRCIKTC